MSVFVTGGAGYIGSHTCVELLHAGYDIVVADDLSNSNPLVLSRIQRITGRDFPFYKIDVGSPAAVDWVLGKHPEISAVIHFAGYKAVGESVEQPVRYYRNNLGATLALLEAMAARGVKRVVFSSSATVYLPRDEMPLEESAPTGCSNPYGWTKYMCERIFSDAASADSSLSVVLLRYFNPIGAHESGLIGEDPRGVPNNLMPYICQVACGRRQVLSVFGNDYPTPDGTGVRDYIHVVDLARGHLAALRYAAAHTGSVAVNLGTGRGCSVLELVHAFEAATGVPVPCRMAPRRGGDIARYYGDPALAHSLLGWKAEKTIEDMCRDSWRWQSRNPQGYGPIQ